MSDRKSCSRILRALIGSPMLWIATGIYLAGCSGKPASKPSGAVETTSVTAEATSAADSTLEFYTDRYLSSEDRLRRRQRRIDEVLSVQ